MRINALLICVYTRIRLITYRMIEKMNREIKFRAWDKWNNIMIPWTTEFFSDMSAVTRHSSDFPDESKESGIVLMQYIGYKDNNVKDIYEGDIIKIISTYELSLYKNFIGQVFYDAPLFLAKNDLICMGLHDKKINNIEIIGNIYQNPELLINK